MLAACSFSECLSPGLLDDCDSLFESRGTAGNLSRAMKNLQELYNSSDAPGDRAEVCFRLARAAYNLLTSSDPEDIETNGGKDKLKLLAEQAVAYGAFVIFSSTSFVLQKTC